MDLLKLSGTPERPHSAQHLTFEREAFDSVYPEAAELLRLHWDEIAPYKDLFILDPNVAFYRDAEKKGILHIIAARMDTLLIGYIVMILVPHHHYQHVLVATDDIHFIHPAYRKGSIGSRLFVAAEKIMKGLGAEVMILRTKVEHNHGALFEHLGYSPLDLVYSKRI